MKPSGLDDEQIIAILKEQEAGVVTTDFCLRHRISEVDLTPVLPPRRTQLHGELTRTQGQVGYAA